MKKTHILTLVGVAFSLPMAQAASLVLNLASDANFGGGLDVAADGSGGGFTFSNTGGGNAPVSFGFDRQDDADFGPFTLTDGTTTQTFVSLTFQLSSTTNQGGTAIQRGAVGAVGVLGNNLTLIDPNENLTISAVTLGPTTDGSAALFAFEGYSAVFLNNTSAGESVTVNDTPFIATGEAGGGAPLNSPGVLTVTFAAGSEPTTVSINGFSGGVSLGGVEAQFVLIPEPSSVLLLGLGGLALLRRRR